MKRAALTALLAAALLPAAVAAATGVEPASDAAGNVHDGEPARLERRPDVEHCHLPHLDGLPLQRQEDPARLRLEWTSAGNGGSGPERGTLVATDKSDTVTLRLTGKRDGTGAGSGSWVLTKASGQPKSQFRSHGTYTSLTSQIGSDLGADAVGQGHGRDRLLELLRP